MSKILLVEHEPSLRHLYEHDLAGEGDVVRAVEDGVNALCELTRERPDVVVLDVGPPRTGGLRVVERMLALDRTIPIVLNTTCRSYGDEPLGWAVDAYVDKSTDTTQLRAKVRELLCSRSMNV